MPRLPLAFRWQRASALLILVSACGEPSPPVDSIAFRANGFTCADSALVDMFIDGVKAGSQVLSAGETSTPFLATAGAHVLSAKSLDSGSEWADTSVIVAGPTVHVFDCSTARPLAPFTGSISNQLVDAIIVNHAGVIDTVAAGATAERKFAADSMFEWSPVPKRYADGTIIPDDYLLGRERLVRKGTRLVTPFGYDAAGNAGSYFTFTVTNTSQVALSIGVLSGAGLRCLLNVPSPSASYSFGYFRGTTGVEVRVYRGADCSDAYLTWTLSQLTALRSGLSGHVPLHVSAAP